MKQQNNKVIFRNSAPFPDCISEIKNNQADNARGLDLVMPMYNLIKDSNNYSNTSGSWWQYYRDEMHDTAIKNSESFKPKMKITGKNPAVCNTKDVDIAYH